MSGILVTGPDMCPLAARSEDDGRVVVVLERENKLCQVLLCCCVPKPTPYSATPADSNINVFLLRIQTRY